MFFEIAYETRRGILRILPHSSAILRSRRDPREPLGYGCAWLLIGSLPLALYLVLIKQLKGVVIRIMLYKRRGIGQYPIFSRTPYFSAKKHTVFLKVEVLGQKGSFSLSSMQPIKDTNPKKLNIQTLPMTHTNRKPQRFRL